ncbi:MAG TPA: hypothetical protein VFB41_00515 [Solirubrobacteraceae bacterium]|nr:hypothetical protein [Solirubrobacteraceae bacterium]
MPTTVAAQPSSSPVPIAVSSKSCTGYVKATIGGQTKCLRRGQYCAKAYKSQYRRYGFTCTGSPARLR